MKTTSPSIHQTCLNSFIIQNMDAATLGVKQYTWQQQPQLYYRKSVRTVPGPICPSVPYSDLPSPSTSRKSTQRVAVQLQGSLVRLTSLHNSQLHHSNGQIHMPPQTFTSQRQERFHRTRNDHRPYESISKPPPTPITCKKTCAPLPLFRGIGRNQNHNFLL
jgi:hypothetical protein